MVADAGFWLLAPGSSKNEVGPSSINSRRTPKPARDVVISGRDERQSSVAETSGALSSNDSLLATP